ncbi:MULTISPECIES: helix-turn-helix domain-containing protein [Paenibacillus]|uniref:helix-turn-helix domain-containing protein n=1 Tax=Paenibacillus TaxID=44249 RepID=UPI0035A248CF
MSTRKKSRVSYSYLTALEENKHSPSFEILEKLAIGLDIPLTQFVESCHGSRVC